MVSGEVKGVSDHRKRGGAGAPRTGSEILDEKRAAFSAVRGPELGAALAVVSREEETPVHDEERFREGLAATQARERAATTTMTGPHRDDFDLLIDHVDMGTFASRGESRTLALTLRLAEAGYLARVRQEAPIVLLDDVLSEMDASRRQRVLEQVCQYQQVLITTTDQDLVRDFFGPTARYYQVLGGRVCAIPNGQMNSSGLLTPGGLG